jgi:AraC-like DNA-binding protein
VLRVGVPSSSYLVLWSLSPTGRHPWACFERLSEKSEHGRQGLEMNTDSHPAHVGGEAVVSAHLPFPSWVSSFVTQLEEGLAEAATPVVRHAFSYYPRLERLYEFTSRNIGRKITRRDAARIACLDPRYFSAYFRDKVGVRFRDWLRLMRVAHAVDVFTSRDVQIQEAATLAGFNSVRSFERAFRVIVGTSPRQFKNRVTTMHPANHTVCRV